MKGWEEFIETSSSTKEILEDYLQMRLFLQELGYTQKELEKISSAPPKLWNMRLTIQARLEALRQKLTSYGFEIHWSTFADYFQSKFNKIDLITPLKDGDNERDNSGYEDY